MAAARGPELPRGPPAAPEGGGDYQLQTPSEAEVLEKDLVELLRHEIEEVLEVHQVEIDRRFDRLATRIGEVERNAVGMPQVKREIAESELASRRNMDQLLRQISHHLAGLIAAVRQEIDDLKSDIRAGRSV